jgi:hypothetical protein
MRENNEKLQKETNVAFALAAFLLNVLIILVLGSSAWLLHSFVVQQNLSASFLLDYKFYR